MRAYMGIEINVKCIYVDNLYLFINIPDKYLIEYTLETGKKFISRHT